MSRRSAVWNLGLQCAPLVLGGALFATVRAAERTPRTVLALACVVYALGVALLLVAKVPVFRQGRLASFGSELMTAKGRWWDRAGYVLMAVATLGTVGFVIAWGL